jgi:hypothetical protein
VGGQHHAPTALPPGKTRYPFYGRLGGPQGRSGNVRNISPHTGIRSPDRPARSQSLYRLSYGRSTKVKVPRNRAENPEGGRGIALLFPDHSARRGRVVSATPRPLYTRERPGTHCTGGWVGPRAGLDVCEKSRPHRDFFTCFLFIPVVLRYRGKYRVFQKDLNDLDLVYLLSVCHLAVVI